MLLSKEAPVRTTLPLERVGWLIEGRDENPFDLLGPHEVMDDGRPAMAVRAYLPHSSQAWVVDLGNLALPRPMRRIHPAGLFEAICPPSEGPAGARYLLQYADDRGNRATMHDPYAFPQLLTEYDLYLLSEGKHWFSYHKLGAQMRTIDGVAGVNFAL